MADSGAKPLQNAMKMAKAAIQLDGESGHQQEAYCEYLRTINYISRALLEEAEAQTPEEGDAAAVEGERMLRLAEQCLERAKSFIGKRADPPNLSASVTASFSCSPGQSDLPATTAANSVPPSDSPVDAGRRATSPAKTSQRRGMSDGSAEPSPFLPPEVFHRIQTVESQDTSKKELTPIEEASRLNQKLKANYEARLARLPPGQAYQKTSLIRKMFRRRVELRASWRRLKAFVKTLCLQRQMMENLIIAKARQDALQRKMEERRLRLQEEANRRFAASGAMTTEEQEQRVLYTNVLEYEQDHDWPKLWKANIRKNPEDVALVSGLVSYLLSRSDHPVVKLLRKHQYRVYNRLYPIVSKRLPQSPALPLRSSCSAHTLLHPADLLLCMARQLDSHNITRSRKNCTKIPSCQASKNVLCRNSSKLTNRRPVRSNWQLWAPWFRFERATSDSGRRRDDTQQRATDGETKPTRCSSVGGQSFSTGSSLSPSLSHNLHANYDNEEGEEPHAQVTVDRENSFEDLEQFLTQLDWAPLYGSTDDTGSDSELTWDPSTQPEQDEANIQELEMRALTEHLKAVVKDIHIAIDQLLSLCMLSFECLNTASSKDLCLVSLEEAFFTPLWSALLALFRRVHREKEQAFEKSMKLYRDISPGDVGVPLKLFPKDPGTLQGSYPYESAVQELKLLIKDCCPQKKLECIVRTLRLICACAEDYRCLHEVDSAPKTAAIGADDLLPILSFVALRCQCPQLVSECAALEEFIHEGYLIGEEGYCLTSMQSALAYVESLYTEETPLPAESPV